MTIPERSNTYLENVPFWVFELDGDNAELSVTSRRGGLQMVRIRRLNCV